MKSLNINIQGYYGKILSCDYEKLKGKGSKFLHLADIYLRFNLGPFRMFYCNQFGIVCTRKDVELISNTTYHLARVILLHRLLYFLAFTEHEWEINLFIQAESEVEIVRFCLVVVYYCIKAKTTKKKIKYVQTHEIALSFQPFKQMRIHYILI